VNRRLWTPAETAILLEMRAAGAPLADIASRLNITVDRVSRRIHTLNLPRRSLFRWTPEANARLRADYLSPKPQRQTMKVVLRGWPTSPSADAAYQQAAKLRKEQERC
jgi:hypothetical protein